MTSISTSITNIHVTNGCNNSTIFVAAMYVSLTGAAVTITATAAIEMTRMQMNKRTIEIDSITADCQISIPEINYCRKRENVRFCDKYNYSNNSFAFNATNNASIDVESKETEEN